MDKMDRNLGGPPIPEEDDLELDKVWDRIMTAPKREEGVVPECDLLDGVAG